MRLNKSYLLFIGIISFSWSCKPTSKFINNNKEDEAIGVIQQLKNKQIEPEWISAKTRLVYQSGNSILSGQGFLKMKTDSALVISVRKFSIEVAKLKITKDSIFFIDRINSQFVEESLSQAGEILGFSPNFDLVQSIVLGKLPSPLLESSQVLKTDQQVNLIQKGPISSVITHIHPKTYDILQVQYYDHPKGIQIIHKLSDYTLEHKKKFMAANREFFLKATETETMQITLNFLQVDWDQIADLSFSIPKTYSRAAY
jgi:hypothetical protein